MLHLLAHSGGNDFGGYAPAALLRELQAKGLRPDVEGVHLHGCESVTFARTLEQRLNAVTPTWQPLKRIPVLGVPGYHFVSQSGRSYSVGAQTGHDSYWTEVGEAIKKDPTDRNIAEIARRMKGRYGDELIEVAVLRSTEAALRGLWHTVQDRLSAEVRGIRPGPFAPDDLAGLWRQVEAFRRIVDPQQPPLPSYERLVADARNLVGRGVARAAEVLDHVLATLASKHWRGIVQGDTKSELRKAHPALKDLPKAPLHSPRDLLLVLEDAKEPCRTVQKNLALLRAEVAGERFSSPTARRWAQAFHDRFSSAVDLLRDAAADPPSVTPTKDLLLRALAHLRLPPPLPAFDPSQLPPLPDFDLGQLPPLPSLDSEPPALPDASEAPARTSEGEAATGDIDFDAAFDELQSQLEALQAEFSEDLNNISGHASA